MILKRREEVSVFIPASTISDVPHLREKTLKIGFIGRALAIYRIDNAVIYRDEGSKKEDGCLMEKVLKYMNTPQYLRKHIFPLSSDLKYVGVLPPLRAPHHPLERRIKDLPKLSYREGVIVERSGSRALVDVGLGKLYSCDIKGVKLAEGDRVIVKIIKQRGKVMLSHVARGEVPLYWGFDTAFYDKPLPTLLSQYGPDLAVATSKYGEDVQKVLNQIAQRWRNCKKIAILFGSPSKGLFEIFKDYGLSLEKNVDFVVNTVPLQGVETIRTEEALHATLAVFNLMT